MSENIKFTGSELVEMRSFYQHELEKAVARVQHIQSILRKLGAADTMSVDAIVTTSVLPTANVVVSEKAERSTKKRKVRKRASRSIWHNFVMNQLFKLERPLRYEELHKTAFKFSGLEADKKKNVIQSVNNAIHKLRNEEEGIRTFSLGNRIKYIAPVEWFNADGTIQQVYLDRTEPAEPKARKTKRRKYTRRAKAETAEVEVAASAAE